MSSGEPGAAIQTRLLFVMRFAKKLALYNFGFNPALRHSRQTPLLRFRGRIDMVYL